MRLILTITISALMLSAPAFAETASLSPPPSGPVSKAKTDFTKPFVDDRVVPQRLKTPQDHPTVELKAGPQP
jgi:hypothetical protein